MPWSASRCSSCSSAATRSAATWYLVSLVAEGKLDPQLAAELPWEEMPKAMERLRNRDVAGKIALTLGG